MTGKSDWKRRILGGARNIKTGAVVTTLLNGAIVRECDGRKVFVSADRLVGGGWALHPGVMTYDEITGERIRDETVRAAVETDIRAAFERMKIALD